MVTRLNVLFLVLVLAIPSASFTQRRPMGPQSLPRRGISLFYEAVSLFTPDTTKVTINVHCRVPERFFIFMRNEGTRRDSAFTATGQILVELLDRQSNTVSRDLRFVRLFRADQLDEDSEGGEITGLSHFSVSPGTYRLAFSVEDKQSGRNFADRSRMIVAKGLCPDSLNISSPFFLRPGATLDSSGAQNLAALNEGGDLLFGGKFGLAVLQAFSPDSVPDFSVHWTLVNKAPLYGIDSTEYSGTAFRSVPGRLVAGDSPDTTIYTLDQSQKGWYAIFLPLPLQKLFEGRCDLRLNVSTSRDHRDVTDGFHVVWATKPGSLFDLDVAIDALQHIATDEQMDEMRSASLSTRTAAFFAFWRAMDPDTTTAYNEKFAEYYRRVDIAMERFRGPKDLEGYRTDQGRIYILYGAPSSSRRIFSPDNAPEEVWTYDNLKQRFVFVDKLGTGVFILTDVEQM